jgi:SAM-dependent methyltransferase
LSGSHFDTIAGEYDEALPAHVVEHYLRKRLNFIQSICPAGEVLDVGCGTGALAARVAAAGYQVTGIDPSEGMLEVLRRRAPAVRAIHGSGTELPFESDAFDLVYCVAVMHHVAEPGEVRKTLTEMVRVSRPGGRVLIWDHNPRNPYWASLMARVPQDTGEERLIPERELLAGLRAGGAGIIQTLQLGLVPDFTPPRALPAAASLERLVERTPGARRLAAHNVIVASKPAQPERDLSSATISPSASR